MGGSADERETFAQLRALADEELIELHDNHAASTYLGTGAYLEKLNRREQQRLEKRLLVTQDDGSAARGMMGRWRASW